MSLFHINLLSFFLALSLAFLGPAFEVSAQESHASFPALISARSRNVSPGRATLPFIISLAQHPQLLQPPYLRLVLGTPDRARAYAYPSNTFTWTPDDGTRAHFVLSRAIDNRAPAGGETRQLVTTFKPSLMTLKDVRSRLGKPIHRYFDNRAQPVELYQISPNTTLAVCEPTNTFDVSQITVCYSGNFLPPVSEQDQAQAADFRLRQINHHLTRGNHERGLALLQEHVSDNPHDIKARLSLASSLRSKCDVNGSFAQYRRALVQAQEVGDVALQKQAIKGLAPFGLVPADLSMVRSSSVSNSSSASASGGSASGGTTYGGSGSGRNASEVAPALTAARGGSTPQ